MLKNKIFLGMLIIGSGIAGVTYGATAPKVLVEGTVGETTYITDNASDLALDLDINGNFNTYKLQTSDIKNVIRYKPSSDRGTIVYRDTNNTLNSFTVAWGGIYDNYQASGFCLTTPGNEYTDCGNRTQGNFTNTIDDLQSFAGNITYFKYIATVDTSNNYPQQAYPFIACYGNNSNTFCASFSNYSNANCKNNGMCKDSTNTVNTSYIDFTSFPDNILGESFLHGSGPDAEGGPISCINIKTQIMLYGNKYNTGMCYTNGLYFSGFTPIQTGKLSIFEVFPSYQDYQNMTNRYNTYCHAPYTQEYCAEAMSGYDQGMDFFTTIENANNNSVFTVEADRLYQYCHLQLNFTEEEKRAECEETTDNFYATGVDENSLPNPFEGISEYIENEINLGIPTPATGSVLDELLTTDDQGKIKIELLKRIQQFKEIYSKITSLFKYRNTQQGVIPGYITSLLLIIILLALFKK